MRDQLRSRYAIDPDSLGGDPGAIQDALERRERALRLAADARQQARLEEAVAAPLLVSAVVADRDQERERSDRDGDPDDVAPGLSVLGGLPLTQWPTEDSARFEAALEVLAQLAAALTGQITAAQNVARARPGSDLGVAC